MSINKKYLIAYTLKNLFNRVFLYVKTDKKNQSILYRNDEK